MNLWLYNRSFADKYETIFCGQGELFSIQELKERTDAYLAIVRKAGTEYAQGGKISEKVKLELSEPFFPKEAFEKGANDYWKSKLLE